LAFCSNLDRNGLAGVATCNQYARMFCGRYPYKPCIPSDSDATRRDDTVISTYKPAQEESHELLCTGLELAAQLRVRLPRTAILLMSGRIGGVPSETLKRLDIRVFINKPLPLKALRQAVIGLVREPVARLTGPEHSFGREGN
jgi:hypothetical protein